MIWTHVAREIGRGLEWNFERRGDELAANRLPICAIQIRVLWAWSGAKTKTQEISCKEITNSVVVNLDTST